MWKFSCDKCGKTLYEDSSETMIRYDKETSYLIRDGKLDVNLLPRYIVFKCPVCGYISKMDIDKLLNPYLELIMERLAKYRLQECLNNIKKEEFIDNFSEDHGISYCGYCPGFLDGDGYCYNDVIEKCIVRRNIVEKKL